MKTILIFFVIVISAVACYDIDKHELKYDPRTNPSLEFVSENQQIRANGIDIISLRLVYMDRPNPELTKVTFVTSEGVFIDNNKQEITTDRVIYNRATNTTFVSCALKATTNKGIHYLTVKVPKLNPRRYAIEFLASLPNIIEVDKSKPSVKRGYTEEIQLFAKLKANPGLPHKDTPVEFIVEDVISSNTSQDFRLLTKTDMNGTASVFFTPGSLPNQSGSLIRFKAVAQGVNGPIVSKEGTFRLE